jgi:glutamate racemase
VSNQPIGIFDSGVGGLSIWKAIHDLLPFESTIYLADSANAPYGDKDRATTQQFSIKSFFLS